MRCSAIVCNFNEKRTIGRTAATLILFRWKTYMNVLVECDLGVMNILKKAACVLIGYSELN